MIQTEVNVQRRKNWVKKLEKQLRKRAEASLGTAILDIYYYLELFFMSNMKKWKS